MIDPSTFVYAAAAGIVAGALSGQGVVKLWFKRMQETQQEHGDSLVKLNDRVTTLEAHHEAFEQTLRRIENGVLALDGRMIGMTSELGRVAGRLESRA